MTSPAQSAITRRVGLLAYGAIGHEHNLAVQNTQGLTLSAVCDTNPERLEAARSLSPDARLFQDASEMLDSDALDLVVVSTPPNTHFHWAKEALTRDLDVVLEKPMALTAEQCDELVQLASERDRLLVVYQNRRYDQDFVTLRRLVSQGAIGDVFHIDTFVGGYSRPCDYWHSDAAVSGGAIFDWGSHFLAQILSLIPDAVAHVSAQNHKRQWMHATNADHAQVTVTFVNGKQATFTHSDLAAARRPKYYVLGTEGAIVGDWNPAAEPAVADLPAVLTQYSTSGAPLSIPLDAVEPFAFHRSIVDYLDHARPMEVNAVQSRDVVAVMEAAEESARLNAMPVVPDLIGRSSQPVAARKSSVG
jgi:predicted dehydrogenase